MRIYIVILTVHTFLIFMRICIIIKLDSTIIILMRIFIIILMADSLNCNWKHQYIFYKIVHF